MNQSQNKTNENQQLMECFEKYICYCHYHCYCYCYFYCCIIESLLRYVTSKTKTKDTTIDLFHTFHLESIDHSFIRSCINHLTQKCFSKMPPVIFKHDFIFKSSTHFIIQSIHSILFYSIQNHTMNTKILPLHDEI